MKNRKFWHFRSIYIIGIATAMALLTVIFFENQTMFFICLPLTVAGIAFTIYRMMHLQQDISQYLHSIGGKLNVSDIQNLFDLPIPAIITSDTGEIVWYNDLFREQVSKEDLFGAEWTQVTTVPIEKIRDYPGHIIRYKGGYFRVYTINARKAAPGFSIFFFSEVTELQQVYYEYHDSRPVIFSIMIDSYEELVKNIKESERSRVSSEINSLFERHFSGTHGVIKRLSRESYLAVIEKRYFDQMVAEKFPILDQAKNIITSERVPATLSIGISHFAESLEKNEEFARQGLEMALGRGGDQIAVKTADGFEFFGGVSQGLEKRTKVKSRILASAMLELIEASSNVLIMGHGYADLDAVGSAIGLARACEPYNGDVHIVLNRNTCLANCLVDHYLAQDTADKELFITPEHAMELMRRETVLFVVDTHSPHLVESREVLQAARQVVVIDHHRRMVDRIEGALILYHESYTSSTSEMVTELSQYLGDKVRLEPYHAEALLAGIMLDTKDFVMKTGVRTFEAAAHLKKLGANTITVKRLFAGTMEDFVNRSELVSRAIVYKNCAIVTVDKQTKDIRLVAPQAADELLKISGVDASFVLYNDRKKVNINARSMGRINVQVIMEAMGGGGHQTMAAAQVDETQLSVVKRHLMETIDRCVKESEVLLLPTNPEEVEG